MLLQKVRKGYCVYLDLFILAIGLQHSILIGFCKCYSEVETLVCLKLFPATPQRPTMAFCFELLDLLEVLLLECQVAVKDFTAAVTYLGSSPFVQVYACKL